MHCYPFSIQGVVGDSSWLIRATGSILQKNERPRYPSQLFCHVVTYHTTMFLTVNHAHQDTTFEANVQQISWQGGCEEQILYTNHAGCSVCVCVCGERHAQQIRLFGFDLGSDVLE